MDKSDYITRGYYSSTYKIDRIINIINSIQLYIDENCEDDENWQAIDKAIIEALQLLEEIKRIK